VKSHLGVALDAKRLLANADSGVVPWMWAPASLRLLAAWQVLGVMAFNLMKSFREST
jgi:hypothetical protein